MSKQISTLLNRIQTDLDTLRSLVAPDLTETTETSTGPVLRDRYTAKAAVVAKAEIERAYETGQIDYDKKRGLKMLVTKRTAGWSPAVNASV